MKINNNKITIPRAIKVPCDRCEDMIYSYFKSLTSTSEGNLSIQYKSKYTYQKEDSYRDDPLCKKCFRINNIKK